MSLPIDVSHAISAVVDYVNKFPNLIPTAEMRLEEVEADEAQSEWIITLSLLDNVFTGNRSFKVFRVDGTNGDVKSMRSSQPPAPEGQS
jgi:hypothetical protein